MLYYKMPPTDAQVRSRERREEVREQQELLNAARDNRSMFTNGQMQGPEEEAKNWMTTHPGDAFQNIVTLLKDHHSAISKLIRLNSVDFGDLILHCISIFKVHKEEPQITVIYMKSL